MSTTDVPAPGEDRSLALALVNTRHRRGRTTIDSIATPKALHDWLAAHSEVTDTLTEPELERVHALREAIRTLLHAAAHGHNPPADALGTVNQASAAAPRALALHWSPGQPPSRHQVTRIKDPLVRVSGAIANDAIELLTDQRSAELVKCDAPNCVRFLLKDHPRRHWCSPGCGERARAARYYHRHTAATRSAR